MNFEEKKQRLLSLNKRELDILNLLLADPTVEIPALAKLTNLGVSTIRNSLTDIYKKLDIQGNLRQKRINIVTEYSDIYRDLFLKVDNLGSTSSAVSSSDHESPKDEKGFPPRPRIRPAIPIAGVIGGLLFVSIVVIVILVNMIRALNQRPVETPPPAQPSFSAQVTIAQETATAEPTIEFTKTPNPTSTTTPTITSTLTPTLTLAPVVVLPFSDNFQNGINPPWSPMLGNWMVTSNGATITINDINADNGALVIDDPTLTNYRLSVDIFVPHVLAASQGNVGVAVRYNSSKEQNLIFVMNSASRFFWGYLSSFNDYLFSLPSVTGKVEANITSHYKLVIEVNGDKFTTWVDGAKYDEFSLTGYEKGGITLITACGGIGSCPSFSNFSLEPLP